MSDRRPPLLRRVSGISEFRWPLKELKVTRPRAFSGTCSSMLPLKVSTSTDGLLSHVFARMRTEPLNVCAFTGPATSVMLMREEKPLSLCEPSTPSMLTLALKTDTSRFVLRGTLMSKSVSTTLLPVNMNHEFSRWFASTTTTCEPSE